MFPTISKTEFIAIQKAISDGQMFFCETCQGLFSAENGALDEHPDDCDECANKKHAEGEQPCQNEEPARSKIPFLDEKMILALSVFFRCSETLQTVKDIHEQMNVLKNELENAIYDFEKARETFLRDLETINPRGDSLLEDGLEDEEDTPPYNSRQAAFDDMREIVDTLQEIDPKDEPDDDQLHSLDMEDVKNYFLTVAEILSNKR